MTTKRPKPLAWSEYDPLLATELPIDTQAIITAIGELIEETYLLRVAFCEQFHLMVVDRKGVKHGN